MILRHSSTLEALLRLLRQHPALPELLRAIPEPQLPRFKISESQEPDKAFGKWAYASGKRDQYESTLALLTGTKETD